MPIGNQYLLLEAYDLLGKRLFGKEWRHDEYLVQPGSIIPSDKLERERLSLEKKATANAQEMNRIYETLEHITDLKMRDVLQSTIGAKSAENKELWAKLDRLPRVDNEYRFKELRADRHQTTVETLLTALKKGQLSVALSSNLLVPKEYWNGRKGFDWRLAYSMVTMSPIDSGARRATAFIPCVQFDQWLRLIEPIDNPDIELNPAELCERWLRAKITKGRKEFRRDDYKEQAMAEIPGLTARAFTRIWKHHAPESWKKYGRPRKK